MNHEKYFGDSFPVSTAARLAFDCTTKDTKNTKKSRSQHFVSFVFFVVRNLAVPSWKDVKMNAVR